MNQFQAILINLIKIILIGLDEKSDLVHASKNDQFIFLLIFFNRSNRSIVDKLFDQYLHTQGF